MARTHAPSITSAAQSPTDERRARMLKYSVAMGIRMLCVIACFFVPPGWWLLVPALGAIVLPYIGVVIANTVVRKPVDGVESPELGTVQLYRQETLAPGFAQSEEFRSSVFRPDEPADADAATDGDESPHHERRAS